MFAILEYVFYASFKSKHADIHNLLTWTVIMEKKKNAFIRLV